MAGRAVNVLQEASHVKGSKRARAKSSIQERDMARTMQTSVVEDDAGSGHNARQRAVGDGGKCSVVGKRRW